MHFAEDVGLPEHSHAAQWGLVLEGQIEMTIEGDTAVYGKGERYFIPAEARHYADLPCDVCTLIMSAPGPKL
jgi:quercetin dioxygenase-like cupin family protein